ncbi:F-box protein At5g39450 [Linum perenne]
MSPEFSGLSLFLALPDDVFAIISRSFTPRDICNLSLSCHSLRDFASSEKVWLTQCGIVGVLPQVELIKWRNGVSSYKALCRFLVCIKPLIGLWVHQNPELGNVVYVMPGFVSVVGCRVIPQELGPLGIEDGPILWSPVFEIISDLDGSSLFFLHGREKGNDYVYPGTLKPADRNCNVLLLEVEPREAKSTGKRLLHSQSFACISEKDQSAKVSRSSSRLSKSQRVGVQSEVKATFSRLSFSDRRKLIEAVTRNVHRVLPDSTSGPLFPVSRSDEESSHAVLCRRRSLLLEMHKLGGDSVDWKAVAELPSSNQMLYGSNGIHKSKSIYSGDVCTSNGEAYTHKKTLGGYLRDSLRQILGKSPSVGGGRVRSKSSSSSSENKHANIHDFLLSGDKIGLALRPVTLKLSSYRAWPNMHDSRFALYKLPLWLPRADQEYAGLWGGTFGWPPGKHSEDKPGKALFFLLISYDESDGHRNLVATKILEGTHYVLHPNGSAMFIVNMDEPSEDPFPWDTVADSVPFSVKHSFAGEGIAHGYGFRYPGSKPGSLFVIQNGLLAFIWKESRAVLTMQRLNLEELIRKGEQVPALMPIANFAYLTKSYSNVFVGFSSGTTCLSSPRQRDRSASECGEP